MAKTSLEKSHSALSNTKLTMLCIIASIFVSILWIGIATIEFIDNITISIAIIAVSGVVVLFSILLFSKFKR